MFGESNNVEPRLFIDEVELVSLRLLPSSLDVLTGTGLQEGTNIIASQLLGSDKDLEADHQHECDFVLLEQSSVDVAMDVLGHHLDDEVYSLLGGVGLGGLLGKRPIEELKELFQRTVVHPIDKEELDEGEVQSRASNGDRSILFSLLVDFFGLVLSILQLDRHFLGLSLSVVQHFHQRSIIQQVSLRLRQTLKQVLIQFLQSLLVGIHIVQQRIQAVL